MIGRFLVNAQNKNEDCVLKGVSAMTEKDMSTKYDPAAVEEGRYQWWIDQGFFKPSGDKKLTHIQLLFHHRMLLVSCT